LLAAEIGAMRPAFTIARDHDGLHFYVGGVDIPLVGHSAVLTEPNEVTDHPILGGVDGFRRVMPSNSAAAGLSGSCAPVAGLVTQAGFIPEFSRQAVGPTCALTPPVTDA
jgi:hypothetical protein